MKIKLLLYSRKIGACPENVCRDIQKQKKIEI